MTYSIIYFKRNEGFIPVKGVKHPDNLADAKRFAKRWSIVPEFKNEMIYIKNDKSNRLVGCYVNSKYNSLMKQNIILSR